MNKNRNKLNQPPTGEGKKQSTRSGAANKLNKRAEVLQAGHAEVAVGVVSKGAARFLYVHSKTPPLKAIQTTRGR